MQLLGRAAVAQLSKAPLAQVSHWLPGQRAKLSEVRDRIPAGVLHDRAQASLTLLQRIATRTAQLTSKMGCPCLTQALSDEFGPLPCNSCAAVAQPAPHGGTAGSMPAPIPGLPPTSGSGHLPNLSLPALGGSSGHLRSGSASTGHGPPSGSSVTGTGVALPPSVPGTPVPSVPAPSGNGGAISAGPITVNSSGATISLPRLPTVGSPSLGHTPGLGGTPGLPTVGTGSLLPSLPLPLPTVPFP
jgi:hypothetical protein